ncbi:MAG: hypothetical protein ABJD53_18315, partial [Gammaproteobacteria bacterium]
MKKDVRKPGLRWPVLLGAAGFASGFFGPMVFEPDANQGPLVGILMTGPAGAVLGLVLLLACTVIGVPARLQWRFLIGTAVVGTLAVLLRVQPEPTLQGYVMDLQVESCTTPIDTEPQILDYWSKRLAEVTRAEARPGWQQDVHEKLRNAPGILLKVQVRKQISIWEKRKPWNHGELFATAGRNAPEENSFYDANGACSKFPVGHAFRTFEKYDLTGPLRPPSQWPPGDLEQLINASPILLVPVRFEH